LLRLVWLATVLFALGSSAQGMTMDPCSTKCGEKLASATSRCGSDTKCMQRGVDQMDACNMQCATRKKTQAQQTPKKCPGMNGKMINCADMMAPAPPPKKIEHQEAPQQP